MGPGRFGLGKDPAVMIRKRSCNVIVTMFCLLIVAPLAFLISDRDAPFIRKWGEIVPPDPKPGGVVSVSWSAEWKRDCPGTIQRHLEDSKGDVWLLPSSVARYSKRSVPRQILSQFTIPQHAACGSARYHVDARYICNWTQNFWPIHVDRPDIEFNISCE